MKKILIQGTSRTATKLYRKVFNNVPDVYLQHEINFDFRFKKDLNQIFKKYKAYNSTKGFLKAIDKIYEDPFFKRVENEYPDKKVLINSLEKARPLSWEKALAVFLEEKSRIEGKNVCGAKNPVHFSFTKRALKKLDDVKVLFLIRDPRAMYASELHQKMDKQRYSGFPQLKIRFLQRMLIFIHVNLEWIWALKTYKKVRRNVVLCKYENLIKEPEKLMKRIFSHCEIPFDLKYLENISVFNSSHKVTGKGVSDHGINKWKDELNRFEKHWFRVLISVFGYRKL